MKKTVIILIAAVTLFGFLSIPVFAEETTTVASLQELIKTLQKQVEELQTQIQSLTQARLQVKEAAKEVKITLRLIKQLKMGMSGDDVKLLQEILATDSAIYPEGLITGYFGSLTAKAVKRFQQAAGIEQVGVVGPKTLSKINELLEEGAGASGKVPPGLLIAPGIRKKLGFAPQPLPGQELPPGIAEKIATTTPTTTPDTTAPVISALMATSTTATSTRITWVTNETANSKVWYSTSTPLVIATSTSMASSSSLVLTHDIPLFNLNASTTYYYLVTSADASANTATSTEQLFITLSQ